MSIISASVLSIDWLNLQSALDYLDRPEVDYVHCDIMDGNFVPNISFGLYITELIATYTQKKIDAHFMVLHPEKYIDKFTKFADLFTFHFESEYGSVEGMAEKIAANACQVGMSVKPATNFEEFKHYLKFLDVILIMTVEPGFGNQKFMEDQLEKIKKTRDYILSHGLKTKIQVDGGINPITAKLCKDAGVEIFTAGSYIFREKDAIESLYSAIS